MRADHPFGADLRGTTVEEAITGQGLDEAHARERLEGWTIDEPLAIEDEGMPHEEEGEPIGEGSVEPDELASPEEAALTIRDDAPGATDREDLHPSTMGDLEALQPRS